jgi:ribosomal protein L12E/L44/L45/RPP1/RPP2
MIDNFQNNNSSSSNNQLASSSNYLNNNYSNENLINMANNIDTISLSSNDYNGTNLNDISIEHNKYEDNSSLIKSLTKEIISNLKENNIDLYDNLTSKKYDESDSDSDSSSKKKKKKKKNKDKDKEKYKEEQEENLKEELQDYILESNPLPSTNSYLSWIFDSCFNYKDFLILFILYFILSQEMIKDFFSKYMSFECKSRPL